MGLQKWLNPINKVGEIVDQLVVDKDKKIAGQQALEELRQQVYVTELNTSTIPWVDALHKMGRQIIAVTNTLVIGFVAYHKPEIDLATLSVLMGGAVPSAVYTYMKGPGKND